MVFNTLTIIILIIMLAAIFFSAFVAYTYYKKYSTLEERIDRFLLGKSAENLEDLIKSLKGDVDYLMQEDASKEVRLKKALSQSKTAFQKAGLVRYNAYNLSGGERSWVLTLLNNYNSGIILNCVTGNETSVMYIRPIKEGKSTVKLTNEEVLSLEKAIGK